MARQVRLTVPDYPHHVVQRGTNQSTVFIDDEDRSRFLGLLCEAAEKTGTQIWAYCLMDNHFHLLLVPTDSRSLGKCIHSITFRHAAIFNKKYSRTGRLWQNRYFSCPVDHESYLWAVARYIDTNPIRAGIAAQPDEWPWSSAHTHIHGVDDGVLTSPGWLDPRERLSYRAFLYELPLGLGLIRAATSAGRPLGDQKFYDMLEQRTGRKLMARRPGPKKRPSEPDNSLNRSGQQAATNCTDSGDRGVLQRSPS